MNDNPEPMTNGMGDQQDDIGTPVFDVAGKRIGTAGEYNAQGGYLVMRKEHPFAHDIAVPLDAIARNEHDGIYLKLTGDEVETSAPEEGERAQQPMVGTTVFDVAGHKLGTVIAYRAGTGYFVLEKGLIFHKDLYIPLTVIAGNYADGLHLTISKDELRNQPWDVPPGSGPAAGDAGAETAPTSSAMTSDADLGPTSAGGGPTVSDRDTGTTTPGPAARDTGMDTSAVDVYRVPVEDGTPLSGNELSVNEQAAADAGLAMREEKGADEQSEQPH